jgi:CubicO group peptidase (beta-lactamase class C family)
MLSRRRAIGLLAALPVLAPALAQAQGETPEQIADRIFGKWLSGEGAPGGVLGVVRGGQLLVAKGYGVRSLDNPVRPDPDTLYCIASVTKTITAFAVLLLCDEGRLELDQPASRWLTDLPVQWGGVTVRQFLCHVSGVPGDGLIRRASWEGSMAVAARLGAGEPGLRTRYNNFNYVVAGRLVEVASGRAYADFVRERIFTPLGMSRSRIGEAYDYNRATGYQRTWRGGMLEPPLWIEAGPQYDAAGRGFSSLNDLLAFLGAIREGKLLSPNALADLTRPYGPAQRGTCGWFSKVAGGVPFTEKLGRLSGYSTDVEFNARGDAIVMMWSLQAPLDRSNEPRAALRQALLGIGSGEPDSLYPSVKDEHDG